MRQLRSPDSNRSPTIGFKLIAKQLRSDMPVAISIIAAVFLSGLVLISTPRLFEETSRDALTTAVEDALPPVRNVTLTNFTRIGASFGDDPLSNIKGAGDRYLEQEFPGLAQSIIRSHTFVADSPQFRVAAYPGDEEPPFDTFMRIRYQEGIEDHIRVVSGALPVGREPVIMEVGADCPPTDDGDRNEPSDTASDEAKEPIDCEEVEVPVYEMAVTSETLDELRVEVGDRLILTPDETDFLYRTTSIGELGYMLLLEISGLVEPLDPAEEYWYADNRFERPRIAESADFVEIFATGITAPSQYRSLTRETGMASWWFTWRYFVDADRVEVGAVDELLADIRSLEANFPPGFGLGHANVSTHLNEIVEMYIERRTLTASMLSLAMVGLFSVSVAVIVVLSALVTVRQRAPLVLLRNRGASRAQLAVSRIAQGLALSVPATAAAYGISVVVAPEATNALSLKIAVILAAASTTIAVMAVLPVLGKDLGSLQTDPDPLRTASARRLVAESVVVAVAVGAVVLLRRRVILETGLGGDGQFDPLLALAPVLLGVAAGIIANRLYELPIRFFSWVASMRPSLVMFVGLRRIRLQPAIARIPMIVILVAVAVAVFSSIIRLSIADGQQESTWHEVGADYRITSEVIGSSLSTRLDLSDVEAVQAVAFALRVPRAATSQAQVAVPPTVELLAIEPSRYREVVDGTRADPGLPDFLVNPPPGEDASEASNPIPVIASQFWLGAGPPARGDRFGLKIGSATPIFEVWEVREHWPGVPLGEQFVIANLEAVESASAPLILKPTDVFVRAGPGAGAEITEAIEAQSQSTRLTSRSELFRALHEESFASGLDRGLALTVVLSIGFGVIAAAASLALTTKNRRRDFGYLRTLGSTSRQAVGMTILEQIPPLIGAMAVGTGLGVGTAFVFEPGINLHAFTGGGLTAELQIDQSAIWLMLALLLGAVLLAIGIVGVVTRRDNLGRVLRVGEDT